MQTLFDLAIFLLEIDLINIHAFVQWPVYEDIRCSTNCNSDDLNVHKHVFKIVIVHLSSTL